MRVALLLQDEGFIRWTVPELCDWLNDGLLEIVVQKPSATALTVSLPLVSGTLQTLPASYNSILRPVRNVKGELSGIEPRKVLNVVSAETINAISPAWHDPSGVAFKQQVKHFIFDEANPRQFYVYPGNDGTGYMEAVVSNNPTPIAATGDETDLERFDNVDNYDVPIEMEDMFFTALTYFVLYRCYAKDSQYAGSAQRAAMYYTQYANVLGIKISVEANMSPNAKAGVGAAAAGVTQ